MGKFEELGHKARELFVQGMSQKDIAKALDVSEATLVEWKKKYEDTEFDWELSRAKALQVKQSTAEWLEDEIVKVRERINIKDGDIAELYGLLDKLLGMRKKFNDSIDTLGETARVMSSFAQFVKENFPDEIEIIKEVTNAFLRHTGR